MTPPSTYKIHRRTNRGWDEEPERKVDVPGEPLTLAQAKEAVWRLHDQANDHHGVPRDEEGPYLFFAVPSI